MIASFRLLLSFLCVCHWSCTHLECESSEFLFFTVESVYLLGDKRILSLSVESLIMCNLSQLLFALSSKKDGFLMNFFSFFLFFYFKDSNFFFNIYSSYIKQIGFLFFFSFFLPLFLFTSSFPFYFFFFSFLLLLLFLFTSSSFPFYFFFFSFLLLLFLFTSSSFPFFFFYFFSFLFSSFPFYSSSFPFYFFFFSFLLLLFLFTSSSFPFFFVFLSFLSQSIHKNNSFFFSENNILNYTNFP
ncbi:unnamed protein product [Acanthosepion pharaonis]|uniref:Uncharacterized protein n=1 Tax=Acanthosepion pharaonis TaxID=158019 RepID=A0A812CGY4_ACAPH|nr:unnamed protein product [Sepia pharaonis]